VCRGRVRRQHRRGAGGQGLSSAVRSGRLRPNHVCLWNAQSDDPRIPPDYWRLYAGVQERDGLGDNLPPDYFTRIEKGAFYGWPYAYIGPNPQPGFAHRAPDKVKATVVPDVSFQPHSSVLDLVFYDGEQFPAEYRGDAFVALKGSWNRSEPTGYKVVRVRFK